MLRATQLARQNFQAKVVTFWRHNVKSCEIVRTKTSNFLSRAAMVARYNVMTVCLSVCPSTSNGRQRAIVYAALAQRVAR